MEISFEDMDILLEIWKFCVGFFFLRYRDKQYNEEKYTETFLERLFIFSLITLKDSLI